MYLLILIHHLAMSLAQAMYEDGDWGNQAEEDLVGLCHRGHGEFGVPQYVHCAGYGSL